MPTALGYALPTSCKLKVTKSLRTLGAGLGRDDRQPIVPGFQGLFARGSSRSTEMWVRHSAKPWAWHPATHPITVVAVLAHVRLELLRHRQLHLIDVAPSPPFARLVGGDH